MIGPFRRSPEQGHISREQRGCGGQHRDEGGARASRADSDVGWNSDSRPFWSCFFVFQGFIVRP